MDKVLNLAELWLLADLASTVAASKPITYLPDDGQARWGIARAFTHDGGGFLGPGDDVREAFVWLSGGTHFGEVWLPVSELLKGLREGRVALDHRP